MAVKKKKVTRKKTVTRKRAVKKPAKKSTRTKKAAKIARKPKENIVGVITHYFPKVQAAVIKLKATVSVGDTLKFKGHTTDFNQAVTSMQINHVPVDSAKKGQEIGLLVNSRVREHDIVVKE